MTFVTWETLSRTIDVGVPFVQPIGGSRQAQFVWDGRPNELSFRLPAGPTDEISNLALENVDVSVERSKGRTWLTVRARGLDSYYPPYQLGLLCAELFETHRLSAAAAVKRTLSAWEHLLQKRPLLSPDAQVGLRGELSVLKARIDDLGADAVESWTAYNEAAPGRHDFRFIETELEVKSTRKRQRHHWISSLQQLDASPGFTLYLLSLQFEQAGADAGRSLPEIVSDIRTLIAADKRQLDRFNQLLRLALYRDEDSEHYRERLILASKPRLIAVGPPVPTITPTAIAKLYPPESALRLKELQYLLDCEAIGVPPDDKLFVRVLGNAVLQ